MALRVMKSTNTLCFSFTSLLSNTLASAGTKVNVKITAPNSAKPSVQASGENILPSTFWKLNIGSRPVIIISLAKKMPLPLTKQALFIKPSLLILL